MPDVDLDAARAAREEVMNGSGPTFTLGRKKYRLKPSPPVVLATAYGDCFKPGGGEPEVREFLRLALVNPADVDKALTAGFSYTDLPLLLDAWKVPEGKSSASPRSSSKGGATSKPTSRRTTASTSRKPSGKTTT